MIAGADSKSAAPAEPTAKKLLLVDDDAPLRRNLVRSLERFGFVVATAASVREAYEVASEFLPELAVVDLNLEDGHGMELVESLQELRPGLKVVVLTGYDSIASSIVATKAGAIGYLAKPSSRGARRRARRLGRAARRQPDVGRPGALGAHPAGLRAVQPQRLGDGAAPQHAPPYAAAHPEQAGPPALSFVP